MILGWFLAVSTPFAPLKKASKNNCDKMISIVQSYKHPSVIEAVTVEQFIEMTRMGTTNATLIRAARNDLKNKNNFKDTAVCAMPHGIFSYGSNDGFLSSSGFIYLDVDKDSEGNPLNDPKGTRDLLASLPFVRASWLSFSGQGVGILVRANWMNKFNFDQAYSTAKTLVRCTGITNDKNAGGLSRKIAVSSDPEIRFNAEAISIPEPDQGALSIPELRPLPSFDEMARAGESASNKKIIYRTMEDFSDGQSVHYYDQGKPMVRLFVRGPILEGQRNNKIFMLAARLAHLNPYIEPAKLTACIQRINLNWCKPPLPFTEVKTICKWVSEKDAAGELRITPESKKIWIDRTVHRSTKEAQSVSAKTVGAIRRKKRIEMLKKLLPELAVALGRKPTKQELADRAGIHFNTVKKYLKEIGWTKFDHVGRAS